jgi:hypothetical protein
VFIFDFGCECGGGSMILMWLFVWNKEPCLNDCAREKKKKSGKSRSMQMKDELSYIVLFVFCVLPSSLPQFYHRIQQQIIQTNRS